PLVALMLAPAGASGSKLKVRVLAGGSGAAAEKVNTGGLLSFRTGTADTCSRGVEFPSGTEVVRLREALEGGEPPSVTRTVIRFVRGPSASVGVQVKTPLVAFMLAPAGASGSKLKASTSPSGSMAATEKLNKVCSLTIRSAMVDN